MADTGLKRSPKLQKGALVQLVEGLAGVDSRIITFQYNPEKLSHTLTPWNPFEVDPAQRGAQAPTVQPFDPRESFSLSLELDAADPLEDGDPIAMQAGIAARIAALQRLTLPAGGNLALVAAALGGDEQAHRPTVPVLLFVWGPGRILPVRITQFSVEESLFSPTLHPLQATVSLNLEVLTPDVFKCQHSASADLAVAAYTFTKLRNEGLAQAHVDTNVDQIRALLSF